MAIGLAWWWIIRHAPSTRRYQLVAASAAPSTISTHSTRPSSPATIAVSS
jgi:hypothetical protein